LEAAGKGWGKLAREIEEQIICIQATSIDPEDQLKILDAMVQKMNALQDFSPTMGPKEYENAKRKLGQETHEVPRTQTHRSYRPHRRRSKMYSLLRSIWRSWFAKKLSPKLQRAAIGH